MAGRDEDHNQGLHAEMSGTSRDVVQAGIISGGVHFHDQPEDRLKSPRPRQLPRGSGGFVNRTEELSNLNAILTSADGDDRLIEVCVIAGTAGAGKTSLALRWTHQIQERFPDGQLYINLRGYDPGEPVGAHDALRRFLIALGTPADAVPTDTDDAAALYRSMLADRRMLILLDNANSVAQVRPLLPGHTRCLVVVTSRGRLSGLAVHDGAHRITLGTLAEPEAVALLRAVTAGFRPVDDDAKLAELSRLCARLPLALRVAAERAIARPHMGLDDLIADLRDESALWDALDTGDEEEAGAVRSVFSWSYRALPDDAARMFRLLGLHPGADFGIAAAAALAGTSVRRARLLLDVLVGAHVLEQTAPDRFEFHDLLRAFASDLAQREAPTVERTEALRRLLDWYLHSADAAQRSINPTEARVPLDPLCDGVTPLTFPEFDQAVDWVEREDANYLPVVRAAAHGGFDRHAWQLPAVLWNAQASFGTTTGWPGIAEIGLAAARRLGDRPAEARLLESQGYGHVMLHRLGQGAESHRMALEIYRELGDRFGEATAFNSLGLIYLRQRRLAEAAARFSEAIVVYGDLGQTFMRAVCQSNLAGAHHEAGRLPEAKRVIDQSLADLREQGDERTVANALSVLSRVLLDLGSTQEALNAAAEAVEIAVGIRDRQGEGAYLMRLGNAQQSLGLFGDALTSYRHAASLQHRLGERSREALTWHGAGETYRRMGRHGDAADFHRRAAVAHRELGDPWNEAIALDGLAEALVPDRPDEAHGHWTEAFRILAEYDSPRAECIRQRIEGRIAGIA
ncbi:ATP-binding protein [Nocardiopsis mangrovi]|uniref:ATP-binding protein n=1 Tax=Nocardiopsis mangrovi TaxID=1179818 RepID=A0ABV9DRL6_9ACTN